MRPALLLGQRRSARGIGALAVVMVLLFIAMLAAAYANRSLLLEQRISANHYRSTQAFEAAEAGLEWALTQLNAGRVDAQCRPTTASGHAPFVFRAAGAASAASGLFGQPPSEGAEDSFMRPVCIARDGGAGWDCHCMPTGRPPLSTLTDAGQLDRPLFVVTVSSARIPGQLITERYPRVLTVKAEGCNRVLQEGAGWRCRRNSPEGRAYAELDVRAALVPALATAPTALLTAKGVVDLGGAAATLARGSAATAPARRCWPARPSSTTVRPNCWPPPAPRPRR
ncbi:pilus assembly PilX N-terminal domain-containing protein [Aquabacterium sp. J223]|uniref:pilus assembly PilX family protein n=1 Tax=Aquabacterium sp. J223 TaxID=2898431 RepID=UPI0021ADFDF0|nr:pilus assembly PilX N-terminal domain-containing protein [Aquabacterium sp. J223]UUX94603.1 pilus assembly PilX N-terminal domain-containing protein [Aquabacterium sp. J223]